MSIVTTILTSPADAVINAKSLRTCNISRLYGEGRPVDGASMGQIQRPIGLVGFLASGSGMDGLRSDPEQFAIGQVHEGQFFDEELVKGAVCRLVCTSLHF